MYPGKKYSHDNYTQELIKKNNELKNILTDKIISTKNIADFLGNKLKNIPKPIAVLYPLLNGDLDFDKVDYIIRDNYHCGFPANIDIHSIMDSFKIRIQKQESNELSKIEILFKPEKIEVIENLLLSRKQLITKIQQEKDNRIANQMLMFGTQNFLIDKRKELDDINYKVLIQNLHENWTDYELVANIAKEIKDNKSSFVDRAIKGNLMQEIVKVQMFDLEPKERLEFYLFSKYKDRKILFERKLNEILKTNFLIDFIYIKPPPLTIRLTPDFEEKVTSIEYSGEPVSFALHSKSNVVNGILKDSFANSFIAVYGEENDYDKTKIIQKIRFILKLQNLEIRKELINKEQIIGEDLVLLVLSAIRKLTKEKFRLSRLWTTGVKRFQEFISKYKTKIPFKCPDFENLTEEYTTTFDILMTKLVTLGLVDQRKKHVAIRTKKGEETALRFLDRNDYCLNSNGEVFVECLPSELLEMRDKLYKELLDNYEMYYEYLTREFELKDVVRQKDMRPSFEEKGLPIVDI